MELFGKINDTDDLICPLCHRPLGEQWNKHHTVPKCEDGTTTVKIHYVCHNKIHSLFTEKQLAQKYNTIELLLQHPEINKFIEWVKNKDPDFYIDHTASNSKKRKR